MDGTRKPCFFLPDPDFQSAILRHNTNLATAIINALTSPFAVTANLLIIYVIAKKDSLHTPSNILLAFLAFSDLLVGLIVQPCFVAFRVVENIHHFVPCALRIVYSESFWVCYGVSFVTLSVISLERFIALRLHLRYNELVTSKRILIVGFAIWLIDMTLTSLEWIRTDKRVRKTQVALWLCCLLGTCAAHIEIFRIVQRHQRQIRTLNGGPCNTSYQRQTKLAINAAYIVGIYVLCNLPVLVVTLCSVAGGRVKVISIFSWAETTAFLNSSISPLVCCWRNHGIRRGVLNILRNVSCFKGRSSPLRAVRNSIITGHSLRGVAPAETAERQTRFAATRCYVIDEVKFQRINAGSN